MKRGLSLLILLTIVCSGLIFAACSDNQTIMKLYSNSNSHGAVWNDTTYTVAICYSDFFSNYTGTNPHNCDGANKILGLSSTTNAHAESKNLTNYATNVCYGDLVCNLRTTCEDSEQEILSLSANTNAHLEIASQNNYANKVCCKKGCTPDCTNKNCGDDGCGGSCGTCGENTICSSGTCVSTKVAYWRNLNGTPIDTIDTIVGKTTVQLVLGNVYDLAIGTNVEFVIYEDDLISDDLIKTTSGIVDSEHMVVVNWTIKQSDLDKTENNDYSDFYFIAQNQDSLGLNINVVDVDPCLRTGYCRDYTDQDSCEVDSCDIAGESVESNNEDIECGRVYNSSSGCIEYTQCDCEWNDDEEECQPAYEEAKQVSCEEDEDPSIIGKCTYIENTADNCDDGFLTYSWNGVWSWDSNNNFGTSSCTGDYKSYNGICRFDPVMESGKRKSETCVAGSNSVPCPASVQLPFFNWISFVTVIVVLGVIYYLISKRQKKVSVRKVVKKKNNKKKRK
jgi:hypothetical protein